MRVLIAAFALCLGMAGIQAAERRTQVNPQGRTHHHVSAAAGPAVEKDYLNSQSVLLKWIKPGTFEMGSPSSELDRRADEVQHTVNLTKGFWLSDHEVTQGEYQVLMGTNPSYFGGDPNRPVERVSWNDAVEYCRKLTDRERAQGRITADQAYRLPTEAEWEYAARAGTKGPRHGELDAIAWYAGNSGSTNSYNAVERKSQPVKHKAANAWGLYDMMGNVSEWCSDRYGKYPTGTVNDPIGPIVASNSNRVSRGGSWFNEASNLRSAFRTGFHTGNAVYTLGFRPALSSVNQPKR